MGQKGSTLYGLEVLSLPRSQPSNRCGSRNKNTTNPALELYTENASKQFFQFSNACQRRKHKVHLQIYTFIINVIWIKRSFVSCSPNNDDYFLKRRKTINRTEGILSFEFVQRVCQPSKESSVEYFETC